MKVYVIVLNWNGLSDTKECVESLLKSKYTVNIIVVDNGSEGNDAEILRRTYPQITVLETGKNLGFAGGNNVGIKYALDKGADAIFLLNNDAIVDENTIGTLVEACLSYNAGIAGPTIYYYDEPEKIQFAGGIFNGCEIRCIHQKSNNPWYCDFILGCAIFVLRDVWEKVGLLDTTYFFYAEETDFCIRAKRAGYRILYVPKASVWHKVSASASRLPTATYHGIKSHMILKRRYFPYKCVVKEFLIHTVLTTLSMLVRRHDMTPKERINYLITLYRAKFSGMITP